MKPVPPSSAIGPGPSTHTDQDSSVRSVPPPSALRPLPVSGKLGSAPLGPSMVAGLWPVPPSKAEAVAKRDAEAREAKRKKLLDKFCPPSKPSHSVATGAIASHTRGPSGGSIGNYHPVTQAARKPLSASGHPNINSVGGMVPQRAGGGSAAAYARAGSAAAVRLFSGGGSAASWGPKSAMEAAFGSLAKSVPVDDSGSRCTLKSHTFHTSFLSKKYGPCGPLSFPNFFPQRYQELVEDAEFDVTKRMLDDMERKDNLAQKLDSVTKLEVR